MSSFPPQGPPLDPAFLAESRIPEILFGTLFTFFFATTFVLARFYSRAVILKTWGADDWWILVSWVVGGIALTVDNCLLTQYGSGRHIETLTLNDIEVTIKLGFVARILYQFTLGTTKIGVCAFYYRVFTDRLSKQIIWAMAACITMFSLPLLFALMFRCHPIAGAWSLTPSKCSSDIPPLYASAALNILADIVLLVFVVPKIAGLRIPKKQKLGLLAVLSLSVLVILAAIIRLVRIIHVTTSKDIPWDSYDVDIWAAVEINTGIFCVAAPAVKPLIRQVAPGFLSSTRRSDTGFPSQSRRYAGGTAISRMAGSKVDKGFELSSRSNLQFPPRDERQGTSKSWIDFEGKKSDAGSSGVSDGDAESEKAILENEVKGGEIRKTARVMVKGNRKESSGGHMMDGFECV